MKRNDYFHLFYGLVSLLVYFGITLLVVLVGDSFQWTTDILNFVNGLVSFAVLYGICYREYEKRGGNRELPPLLPCSIIKKPSVEKVPVKQPDKKDDGVAALRNDNGYSRKAWAWIVLLGISSCVALNNWFSILGLFEKISTYKPVSDSIYYGSLWMVFARTAVLAPLVEEFLVRGMVYRGISHVTGRIIGMIASSLIFALMHGNLLQGIYTFILGILLSYVYDMSGRRISAPVLLHMSANVISVLGSTVAAVAGFLTENFYILTVLSTILVWIAVAEIYQLRPVKGMKEV